MKSLVKVVLTLNPANYLLANELHKKRSKYNKGIKYLLCVIDLLSKFTWIVTLQGKRGITIINAFQKIISKRWRPDKIWVDQSGEFCNKLFKRFLKINKIEIYSTYN